MYHETTLSRPLNKGYVQCTACEHWCAVAPGASGRCGVRRNLDGALRLVVYGRAIAAQTDPIEKKPLHHFLPAGDIFSIGTVGCNLFCRWCQNWDLSQRRDFDPDRDNIGAGLLPADIVHRCVKRGIPAIAFTYNEPAVFFEYAYDTARLAHAAGLRTVFVSSGFETLEALSTIAPYLDAMNVDLKSYREETYRRECGARLAPVLRNIEHLVRETNVWIEVTTLVIPDLNDGDAELTQIAQFLAGISRDIPWHVSAFTPRYRMRAREPTSPGTLRRAWEIGRSAGLRYVYSGNIVGHPLLAGCADTRCPSCDETLIRRHAYHVRTHWSTPGRCHRCGTSVAGVWT